MEQKEPALQISCSSVKIQLEIAGDGVALSIVRDGACERTAVLDLSSVNSLINALALYRNKVKK